MLMTLLEDEGLSGAEIPHGAHWLCMSLEGLHLPEHEGFLIAEAPSSSQAQGLLALG